MTLAERVVVLTHTNVGYRDHPLQAHFPALAAPVDASARGSFVGASVTILPGRHHRPRVVRGRGQRGDGRRAPAHAGGRRARPAAARARLSARERSARGVAATRPSRRSAALALRCAGLLRAAALLPRPRRCYFFPLRLFALEGLARGRAALLEPARARGRAPRPAPRLVSRSTCCSCCGPTRPGSRSLLALHVPLAALCLMALARTGLGLSDRRRRRGALVYALGGFALSTLNLYVYVHALAWAPAAVLGLLARRPRRPARDRPGRASPSASSSPRPRRRSSRRRSLIGVRARAALRGGRPWPRMAAAVALGAALAAPSAGGAGARWSPTAARAAGFPPEVVLVALDPPPHPGPGGDRRLPRRYRAHHRALVGRELLPARLPVLPEPLPGLGDARHRGAWARSQDRGPRRRLAARRRSSRCCSPSGAGGSRRGLVEAFDAGAPLPLPVEAVLPRALRGRPAGRARRRGAARAGRARAWRRLAWPRWPRGRPGRQRPALARAGARAARARSRPASSPRAARGRPPRHRSTGCLRDAAAGGAVATAAGGLAVLAWRGRVRRPGRGARRCRAARRGPDARRRGAEPRHGGVVLLAVAGGRPPSRRVAAGRPGVHLLPRRRAAPTCPRARCGAEHELWTFALLRDTAAPVVQRERRAVLGAQPRSHEAGPARAPAEPADAGARRSTGLMAPIRLAGVAHVISLDPLAHPALVLAGRGAPARPRAPHRARVRGARPAAVGLARAPRGRRSRDAARGPAVARPRRPGRDALRRGHAVAATRVVVGARHAPRAGRRRWTARRRRCSARTAGTWRWPCRRAPRCASAMRPPGLARRLSRWAARCRRPLALAAWPRRRRRLTRRRASARSAAAAPIPHSASATATSADGSESDPRARHPAWRRRRSAGPRAGPRRRRRPRRARARPDSIPTAPRSSRRPIARPPSWRAVPGARRSSVGGARTPSTSSSPDDEERARQRVAQLVEPQRGEHLRQQDAAALERRGRRAAGRTRARSARWPRGGARRRRGTRAGSDSAAVSVAPGGAHPLRSSSKRGLEAVEDRRSAPTAPADPGSRARRPCSRPAPPARSAGRGCWPTPYPKTRDDGSRECRREQVADGGPQLVEDARREAVDVPVDDQEVHRDRRPRPAARRDPPRKGAAAAASAARRPCRGPRATPHG